MLSGENERTFAGIHQEDGAVAAGSAAHSGFRQTEADECGETRLRIIRYHLVALSQNRRPSERRQKLIERKGSGASHTIAAGNLCRLRSSRLAALPIRKRTQISGNSLSERDHLEAVFVLLVSSRFRVREVSYHGRCSSET